MTMTAFTGGLLAARVVSGHYNIDAFVIYCITRYQRAIFLISCYVKLEGTKRLLGTDALKRVPSPKKYVHLELLWGRIINTSVSPIGPKVTRITGSKLLSCHHFQFMSHRSTKRPRTMNSWSCLLLERPLLVGMIRTSIVTTTMTLVTIQMTTRH